MLIPVFTLYAPKLTSANAQLIGVAFGAYGLSQGILQIPFGLLSDHFGRKPIITLGLIFFCYRKFMGRVHSFYLWHDYGANLTRSWGHWERSHGAACRYNA